jgi:hypothetical protein
MAGEQTFEPLTLPKKSLNLTKSVAAVLAVCALLFIGVLGVAELQDSDKVELQVSDKRGAMCDKGSRYENGQCNGVINAQDAYDIKCVSNTYVSNTRNGNMESTCRALECELNGKKWTYDDGLDGRGSNYGSCDGCTWDGYRNRCCGNIGGGCTKPLHISGDGTYYQ